MVSPGSSYIKMTGVMDSRNTLLKLLSDGKFHSGEAMGDALCVTRMAVWKHMKALREMGISFEVIRGKGYRLPAPIELLDDSLILSMVAAGTRGRLGPVEVLLDSDASERNAALSPDGRWIAYESNESGRREVYVRPFPGDLPGPDVTLLLILDGDRHSCAVW